MIHNIVSIVGARPQFIKAAVVGQALQQIPTIHEISIHTGQHYSENMSDIFYRDLDLKQPDYNLEVGSASHGEQTGKMLIGIEKILLQLKPELVLIYGDTNSTIAGALAAAKLHIPIAHVEAGLRSFNKKMPEEINRIIADQLSDLLFCPTEAAVKNAISEGISKSKIHLVGDVMYDAALYYANKAQSSAILQRLHIQPNKYILATIHRAENTDNPNKLLDICENLINVALHHFPVVLPLHPRTHKILQQEKIFDKLSQKLILTEPMSYIDMMTLEKRACMIITDSGGVQKEAFFYNVPCLTIRDETEWVELIENGWNHLVSSNKINLLSSMVSKYLWSKGKAVDLYGAGKAVQNIIAIICRHLNIS